MTSARLRLGVPDVFAGSGRHHVVVQVGSDQLVVDVDDELVAAELADGLVRWDSAHTIVLGNEHGGTRPWLGRIQRALAGAPVPIQQAEKA